MVGARSRESELGETLVEVLVAVIILGLTGVAVMAGLGLAVKSSSIHRAETTGGAYVRSYAEAIQNYVATSGVTNYKPCAAANAYNVSAVTSTLNLPPGYKATQDAALSVGPTGATGTCSSDTGTQQLTLHVASASAAGVPDGRATETLVIIVRKPCDPSVSACS